MATARRREEGATKEEVKFLVARSRRAVAEVLKEFAALGIRPGFGPGEKVDAQPVIRLVKRIEARVDEAKADQAAEDRAEKAEAAGFRIFRPE